MADKMYSERFIFLETFSIDQKEKLLRFHTTSQREICFAEYVGIPLGGLGKFTLFRGVKVTDFGISLSSSAPLFLALTDCLVDRTEALATRELVSMLAQRDINGLLYLGQRPNMCRPWPCHSVNEGLENNYRRRRPKTSNSIV